MKTSLTTTKSTFNRERNIMNFPYYYEQKVNQFESLFFKYYDRKVVCKTTDDFDIRNKVLNTECVFDDERDFERFESYINLHRDYSKKCISDITDEYVRQFIETF